jgi:carbon starvation protein CstA
MTDQEKPKEIIEERHYFDSNDPDKGSESASKSGFKDKIVGKITSTTLNKAGENNVSLPEAVRISNNIRTILMGLFILIGFIVLVFAIFAASVTVELAQTATGVFMVALIAAIIGAFALFGVVVYQIRGENKAQH